MKVKLYDPHPGFGGAIMALPRDMKNLVDKLNGQEVELTECLEKLRGEASLIPGKTTVEAVDKEFIRLQLEQHNGFIHSWRLLRYKKCGM